MGMHDSFESQMDSANNASARANPSAGASASMQATPTRSAGGQASTKFVRVHLPDGYGKRTAKQVIHKHKKPRPSHGSKR